MKCAPAELFLQAREFQRSVKHPSTVKDTGDRSFQGCARLERLGLHEGLERNGKGAFGRCEGLTKVDIPSTVKLIDNVAFLDCKGLEFLSLNDGLERIGIDTFRGCE
eukprot:scaffold13462_cov102-Cylindrotheca_fusiformis.AAC.2